MRQNSDNRLFENLYKFENLHNIFFLLGLKKNKVVNFGYLIFCKRFLLLYPG
jgi:hypothetical protein